MKMKLVLVVISVGLTAWMGASFVSPAVMTPAAGPVVAPQHGDSHRLGAVGNLRVDLPSWGLGESTGVSPLIGTLVTAD